MNDFQQALAQALLAPAGQAPAMLRGLADQPGFSVYRNTVLKGCVDALEANFPTLLRLVGPQWFRAAGLAYVRDHPPADGRLLTYGDEHFAAFVQAAPTAAQVPYLAGVARLDSLWRACHGAADAPVLPAAALAELPAKKLAAHALQPHPATRWAWFDAMPVATIWSRNRGELQASDELTWTGDGLLLTREDGAVHWRLLPRAGCVFLDACARGCNLGEAAQQALAADPGAPLAEVLQLLLCAGAFTFTFTAPARNLP